MKNAGIADTVPGRIAAFHRLQGAGLIARDPQFFPAIHYPPITMYPPASQEELFRGYTNPDDGLFVVYAHLPFCQQCCAFCHYPNRIAPSPEEKNRYLEALAREIDLYTVQLGLSRIRARSILIGGGTPTYLTPEQLERFLNDFDARVDRSSCTQFNYDVDPATLIGPEGKERLRILRAHGVDRLTIGMQSLVPETLQRMRRHHTVADSVRAMEEARAAGFLINIEFIFGYPGDTLRTWSQTLQGAVALEPDEIQIYQLKIIPYGDRTGSVVHMHLEHQDAFPDPETILTMKETASTYFSEHGYNENLNRVYSKDPAVFSHYVEDQCCRLVDQLGFGLTAFSSLRDRFILNTNSFSDYYNMISAGRLPINRGLTRDKDEQTRWGLILPLKNRKVIKSSFTTATHRKVDEVFRRKREKLEKHGLLTETDRSLSLTDLGRFFANEVCHQFYHPRHLPFPRAAYASGELCPHDDWEA